MCFPFDEDGFHVGIAVPTQSDSFSALSLLETAEVEVEVFVVEVDGSDS